MIKHFSIVFAFVAWLVPANAHADVYSYYVYSLEWIVDSSELIVDATIVCEQNPNTKKWETKIEKTNRVIRSADKKNVPEIGGLSDAVTAPGKNHVLLFGYRNKEKGTMQLAYCIFLNKHAVPADSTKRAEYYQFALPNYTSAGAPMSFNQNKCIAIDKMGEILVDPAQVVAAVDKRAALKSPPAKDGEGLYLKHGSLLEDSESDYNVLVPFDPEFKKDFLAKLRDKNGFYRYCAATHLAHYNEPDVIDALKSCLKDDYIGESRSGPDNRAKKVYLVRQGAYEALQALKVVVPRPELDLAP